jgi:hypothetical protein
VSRGEFSRRALKVSVGLGLLLFFEFGQRGFDVLDAEEWSEFLHPHALGRIRGGRDNRLNDQFLVGSVGGKK